MGLRKPGEKEGAAALGEKLPPTPGTMGGMPPMHADLHQLEESKRKTEDFVPPLGDFLL